MTGRIAFLLESGKGLLSGAHPPNVSVGVRYDMEGSLLGGSDAVIEGLQSGLGLIKIVLDLLLRDIGGYLSSSLAIHLVDGLFKLSFFLIKSLIVTMNSFHPLGKSLISLLSLDSELIHTENNIIRLSIEMIVI